MRALALAMLVVVACAPRATPAGPGTAPTITPAARPFPEAPYRIGHAFEPARYRLNLVVEDRELRGEVAIEGTVTEPSEVLWLHGRDLVISRAIARSDTNEIRELEVSPSRADQKRGLRSATPLAPGRWTLELAYTAGIEDAKPPEQLRPGYAVPAWPEGAFRRVVGGAVHVYTLSQPIYARRWVPCIDEPDRKVPWQLALDVPAASRAFANTEATSDVITGARRRVEFAPTRPLPSYLIAFAVGPFDVVDAGRAASGVPIRVIAPKGQGPAVAAAAALAPELLDRVERWFGIPYAYGKLDLVSVPANRVAMEHPGLITFDDSILGIHALTLEGFASIATHELVHQWFGNLVTPRWWNDLWLSEGLTSWLTARLDGTPRPDLWPEGAIRQPLADDAAVETAHRDIDYLRASVLPHVLGRHLGAPFDDALRAYVKRHADGVVTAEDLIAAIDGASPHNFRDYITRVLDGERMYARLEVACHELRIRRDTAGAQAPACIAYDRDGARAEACVDAATTPVTLPGRACPRWWLPVRELADGVWTTAPMAELASAGWPHLTAAERAAVFPRAPFAQQLALALPVALSTDAGAAGLALAILTRAFAQVPAALHARLAALVRKQLAPRRRDIQLLVTDDRAELAIARLLTLAGDTSFIAPAIARLDRAPANPDLLAIALASSEHRRRVMRALPADYNLRRAILTAISADAPADAIFFDLAAFAGLAPGEQAWLLAGSTPCCEDAFRALLGA